MLTICHYGLNNTKKKNNIQDIYHCVCVSVAAIIRNGGRFSDIIHEMYAFFGCFKFEHLDVDVAYCYGWSSVVGWFVTVVSPAKNS